MSFNILLKDIIDNFNSNFKFKLKIGFFKPEYTCFIIIFLKTIDFICKNHIRSKDFYYKTSRLNFFLRVYSFEGK